MIDMLSENIQVGIGRAPALQSWNSKVRHRLSRDDMGVERVLRAVAQDIVRPA